MQLVDYANVLGISELKELVSVNAERNFLISLNAERLYVMEHVGHMHRQAYLDLLDIIWGLRNKPEESDEAKEVLQQLRKMA